MVIRIQLAGVVGHLRVERRHGIVCLLAIDARGDAEERDGHDAVPAGPREAGGVDARVGPHPRGERRDLLCGETGGKRAEGGVPVVP